MPDKMKTVGSKAEVFHEVASRTSGGLKKKDLMKTKHGRIVSRRKHSLGLKAVKRLFALGYKPKKGTFKAMRKSMVDGRKKKRGTRKHGGWWAAAPAAPAAPATAAPTAAAAPAAAGVPKLSGTGPK